MACDETSNQLEKNTQASFEKISQHGKLDFELQSIFQNIEHNQNEKENSAQIGMYVEFLKSKYELNKNEIESLFHLGKEVDCPIGGLTIGAYATEVLNDLSQAGKWKLMYLNAEDEVMTMNSGHYKIHDGDGILVSDNSESELKASIFDQFEVPNYIGKWSDGPAYGEILGIQIDDDSNSMVGFWTDCRF
jgi:hypothetical protein